MSTEALLSKRVSVKIFTKRARWRNMVCHHGQRTGLKRDFDSSRKRWTFGSGPLLCQRFRKRREETASKRKRTEISLVFVTIMKNVVTYVVCNNFFWN